MMVVVVDVDEDGVVYQRRNRPGTCVRRMLVVGSVRASSFSCSCTGSCSGGVRITTPPPNEQSPFSLISATKEEPVPFRFEPLTGVSSVRSAVAIAVVFLFSGLGIGAEHHAQDACG